MPRAPAICDRCQFVFPSGFELGRDFTFEEGCKSGPCPKCGHPDGTIPDGTYSAINGVIEVVATGEVSRDQLARLLAIVGDKSPDAAKIAQQIETDVPKCSFLARYMPQDPIQLAAYLALLLTVLTVVIQRCDSGGSQTINIEQVIQNFYEQ